MEQSLALSSKRKITRLDDRAKRSSIRTELINRPHSLKVSAWCDHDELMAVSIDLSLPPQLQHRLAGSVSSRFSLMPRVFRHTGTAQHSFAFCALIVRTSQRPQSAVRYRFHLSGRLRESMTAP